MRLADRKIVLYGTGGKQVLVQYRNRYGRARSYSTRYEGVIPWLERRHSEAESDRTREQIEGYMREVPCPECGGSRLRPATLAVKVGGRNIHEVTSLAIRDSARFFAELELSERDRLIAERVLKEVNERLTFLLDVGLDYLKLGQPATTLSGGEAQRIKLARELARRATGRTLYLLDEPTTGLHFADVERLLDVLHRLVDAGNTVVVIEHNLDVVKTADWIIDLGPEGGKAGGEVIAEGTPEAVARSRRSFTGRYLRELLATGEVRGIA